jgi:hypothetical protein
VSTQHFPNAFVRFLPSQLLRHLSVIGLAKSKIISDRISGFMSEIVVSSTASNWAEPRSTEMFFGIKSTFFPS